MISMWKQARVSPEQLWCESKRVVFTATIVQLP